MLRSTNFAGTNGDNKAVYYNTKGTFKVSAFLRPVPGDLHQITKKTTSNGLEETIKYAPSLY